MAILSMAQVRASYGQRRWLSCPDVCAKCGSELVATTYMASGFADCYPVCRAQTPDCAQGHLHRRCQTCGWAWSTRTNDSPDDCGCAMCLRARDVKRGAP